MSFNAAVLHPGTTQWQDVSRDWVSCKMASRQVLMSNRQLGFASAHGRENRSECTACVSVACVCVRQLAGGEVQNPESTWKSEGVSKKKKSKSPPHYESGFASSFL